MIMGLLRMNIPGIVIS
ncbi:hypothetical protein, partial [Brachyspira hyodysenteriae]